MQKTTKICKASLGDLEIVSDLASRIWPHAFKGILNAEQLANLLKRIYSIESLEKQMVNGEVFWIAYENEQPLGYVSAFESIEENKKAVVLKKIYILPEAQGKGLGKMLIKTALDHFPNNELLFLYVNSDNKPAISFYISQGFKELRKEKVQMGDFEFIDCIMAKPLS